ncbi:MAG: class I SAM-dependent methyltransferase [Burkholderiales bacterium]
MSGTPVLTLKAGRERSLHRRHPWLFSGAVGRIHGAPQSGDTVEVRDAQGRFLAWAAYSPASQIRARVWSFEQAEVPGPEFFRKKIVAALALRRSSIPGETSDALRLVHAESDGLPGLVADRYARTLVVQLLSAGCERWRAPLIDILRELSGCTAIYERSDPAARELEGLAPAAGPVSNCAVAGPVRIVESDIQYEIDVVTGQKTGFFLDQRDNRRSARLLARDRDALDCFCFSGGFSLSMLAGGASSVLSIDSSGPALAAARRNLALNGLDAGRVEWREADVFKALRDLHREGRQFDFIVLDPPRFAPTPKDAARAARGYKDINLYGLRLLRPGGLLATFSCSGGISPELFQKIVAGAAADAGASLLLRERYRAAADHPVRIEFPEGEYLKGLLLEKL